MASVESLHYREIVHNVSVIDYFTLCKQGPMRTLKVWRVSAAFETPLTM